MYFNTIPYFPGYFFYFRFIIKLYSLHFRSSIRDALENPGGQPVTAKRAKQKGYSLLEKVTIV